MLVVVVLVMLVKARFAAGFEAAWTVDFLPVTWKRAQLTTAAAALGRSARQEKKARTGQDETLQSDDGGGQERDDS